LITPQVKEVNMSNSIDTLIEALVAGRQDIEDGYSGKTKVSATRARKALASVRDAAQEARKELLAISKAERPATPVDLALLDAPEATEES
jgi:hypothetical protein